MLLMHPRIYRPELNKFDALIIEMSLHHSLFFYHLDSVQSPMLLNKGSPTLDIHL